MGVIAGDSLGFTVLSVGNVGVSFGGINALRDVSISVQSKEVVGLIGPNGAGKTTLLNVISGTYRTRQGTVYLDNVDVSRKRSVARAKRGLARTFQRTALFPQLSTFDHLLIGYMAGRAQAGNHRDRWRTRATLESIAWRDDSAHAPPAMLDRLQLRRVSDVPAGRLPLGSARLVDLGRVLCSRPKVLLLDEPVSGLDSSESLEIAKVLCAYAQETGAGIFVVEHDLSFASSVSDRLIALDFGRVLIEGSPQHVLGSAELQAAYLGAETPSRGECEGNSGVAVAGTSKDVPSGKVEEG